VPQTATVWAACSQSDLVPGDAAAAAAGRTGGAKKQGRPQFGAGGFDLVLADESDEGEPRGGRGPLRAVIGGSESDGEAVG
jgi:hypothetical protein